MKALLIWRIDITTLNLKGDSYETQGEQKAVTVLEARNGPGRSDRRCCTILDR